MKKPTLVVMAAGMGSRFGGLKQMTPIDPQGNSIIQYSLYDARLAGFDKVVFIIKHEIEHDFREKVGRGVEPYFDVSYVFQELTSCLPQGFTVPEGRTKPWGTGHAVLAARKLVDAPFCAINADDFYGAEAFRLAYDHLTHLKDEGDVAMVGYLLKNTLSENGYVSRGVCEMDETGRLTSLTERTHIVASADGPLMTEDLRTYTRLEPDTVVSMNMWAFPHSMMTALEQGFPLFLREKLPQNPEKAEYYLPMAVDAEMQAGRAGVSVKTTHDKWYGVTNPEDKQDVVDAVARLAEAGLYPAPLWPEA